MKRGCARRRSSSCAKRAGAVICHTALPKHRIAWTSWIPKKVLLQSRLQLAELLTHRSLIDRMPRPPAPWTQELSIWKAVARWGYLYERALLALTAASANPKPTIADSATVATGARHKYLTNEKFGERDPLRSLDSLFLLERKLRVEEAWKRLSDNAGFLILRLSRLKVKRQCGMPLLWRKASRRWMPQALLPTSWKSRMPHWHGRDDAGIRCLLCLVNGKRRPRVYQYRCTLDDHISRDHFF